MRPDKVTYSVPAEALLPFCQWDDIFGHEFDCPLGTVRITADPMTFTLFDISGIEDQLLCDRLLESDTEMEQWLLENNLVDDCCAL